MHVNLKKKIITMTMVNPPQKNNASVDLGKSAMQYIELDPPSKEPIGLGKHVPGAGFFSLACGARNGGNVGGW